MPAEDPRTATADQRREIVARSAIRILARDGVRALTHRAIDKEANLPQGSTSHVARSRDALLTLVVNSLASRTLADSSSVDAKLTKTPDSNHITTEELADLLAELVDSLADRRDDMRARYALLLELHSSPALHEKLATGSEVHLIARRITASALTRAGLPHSSEHIDALLRLIDALVFYRSAIDGHALARPLLITHLRGLAAA